MGVKFNFYRGRNMESELLTLKNNYDFWDLIFKLDNNEEIYFNDLEYLIWSIIKLKYENLNNDEKIELKKSIVENRMIHCIQKFEQYFNKNYINGLIKESKYREWFKLEGSHIICLLYTSKYYLRQPNKRTAKALNRTVESVRKKAARMGINTYYDGYLSARVLGRCFSTNERAVKRWVEKFNLPAIKVKEPNRTRYQIDPEQFWKWADTHRSIINWSGYDLCSILPEPRWVEFEQARYKTKRHGQRFTDNEIVRIKHMKHRGLNTKEIAAEMGRTEVSIRHVLKKIA